MDAFISSLRARPELVAHCVALSAAIVAIVTLLIVAALHDRDAARRRRKWASRRAR